MPASVILALASFLLAGLIQAVGLAIWGSRLTQRVLTIEREIVPLKALPQDVAVLKVKLDSINEYMRDLAANTRWLREPADYKLGEK